MRLKLAALKTLPMPMLLGLLMSCGAGASRLAPRPRGPDRLCDNAALVYRDFVKTGQVADTGVTDQLYLCLRREIIKTACYEGDEKRLEVFGILAEACK